MGAPGLSGKHVVITRPPGQAHKLKALVEAAGGEATLFPLIAITALGDYRSFDQTIAALADYDWAIFISSNAVQHGMPRILRAVDGLPPHLRFAAIGPVTASELVAFGVTEVLIPQHRFDSESLLALPQMHDVRGKKCMIVRGIGGREVLAETLQSRGADVIFAECYQRVNPQTDARVLQALWQNKQLDALVVTSSEAMRHLLQLAEAGNGNADWLRAVPICVNHARIAEEASDHHLHLCVADAPGDEAMLQCLTKTLNEPT
jgi:Uroporphyrinogen-III synthase